MRRERNRHWLQYLQGASQNGGRLWIGLLAVGLVAAMIVSWNMNQGGNMLNGPAVFGANQSVMAPFSHVSGGASGSAMASSAQAPVSATTTVTAAGGAQRMVIEQASLNITLPDVTKAEQEVTGRATADGGFVESAAQSTGAGSAPSVTMTLRVPESDFSDFVGFARALGTVTYFSQTGQDVTQQYGSLTQRTAELQSEQTAYARLYRKAQSMRDMLQIQQALAQVNSQISALSAQEHSLRRSVQLSTVFLTLSTSTFSSSAPPPIVAAWNQLVATLGSSALSLLTVVAWVVPWVIVFFLIVLITRAWTRKKR